MSCHQRDEYIVSLKRTQGSETSQYLKEKKSSETPLVAASERGIAQTCGIRFIGVVGSAILTIDGKGRNLESLTKEGDSPVP